jgi:hypothetical protein
MSSSNAALQVFIDQKKVIGKTKFMNNRKTNSNLIPTKNYYWHYCIICRWFCQCAFLFMIKMETERYGGTMFVLKSWESKVIG